MISISNSEVQLWKKDRRRWFIQYYLRRVPSGFNVTGTFPLGTRMHAALEGYYAYGLDPVITARQIYAHVLEEAPFAGEDIQKESDMVDAMLSGYMEWIEETGEDQAIEFIAAEREIRVPFPAIEGVELRGRLDVQIYHDFFHTHLFMDHKSAAQFRNVDQLSDDEQAKWYTILQRLEDHGHRVDGGCFNQLRKVKRTGTAKPPFYKRDVVRFNSDQLNSMYLRIFSVITDILDTRAKLDAGGDHRMLCYPSPGNTGYTDSASWLALSIMMDDGSDWEGYLEDHFRMQDPYARYSEESVLKTIGIV
jgi:PD-(D/E)XK nuclease superfamily